MTAVSKVKQEGPDIYIYTDYRVYLKDVYTHLKAETPYFSYRYFSKVAGFTSPNFLKLVIDGERNLSHDGLNKFCQALKLKGKEARYFRLLVLMNQAVTTEEKDFYTRQLLKSKVVKTLKPLSQAQYEYYSHWFHIPLRELIGLPHFKNDPKWIASQFTPHLTENQVKDGLKTLLKLALIRERADGSYEQTDAAISTGDDVVSLGVENFHKQMMELAAASIDRFDDKEREISSLTMGVSRATQERLKEMIRDFRKEVIALVSGDKNHESVVQMNFQLFPLVRQQGGEDA